jgi:hypothetical protein
VQPLQIARAAAICSGCSSASPAALVDPAGPVKGPGRAHEADEATGCSRLGPEPEESFPLGGAWRRGGRHLGEPADGVEDEQASRDGDRGRRGDDEAVAIRQP